MLRAELSLAVAASILIDIKASIEDFDAVLNDHGIGLEIGFGGQGVPGEGSPKWPGLRGPSPLWRLDDMVRCEFCR